MERRSRRRSVSVLFGSLLAVAGGTGVFLAGRASVDAGEPVAKEASGRWERVPALQGDLTALSARMIRIATSGDVAKALQAVQAATPRDRSAAAAEAIRVATRADAGGDARPLTHAVSVAGPNGVVVIGESPPSTVVETWGDPHENLTITIQAGDIVFVTRAPLAASKTPAKPK